ncbi:MAG: bifunctional diguanylate cyclase/phosphodiesterase [Sphingomonas sp.]|nr:bifunctional diguanylate cyclase/phosphodiesterase [Sphingomonas sp.]
MISVARCIVEDHDPWLVVLALAVSLLGSAAMAKLFTRLRGVDGAQRYGWLLLSSVSAGTSIWCTHFIAMIAYETSAPVRLNSVLTLISLLIAVVAAVPGIALATTRFRWSGIAGGAVVGLAISAMHYTGMAAYRIDGLVTWNWRYIFASILSACVLSAIAFHCLRLPGRDKMLIGAGFFSLAVMVLHFTGMTAMHVVVLDMGDHGMNAAALAGLAIATALAALLVIGCLIAAALIDQQRQDETFRRLRRMALHDPLTDLPNRASFNDELARRLRRKGGTEHMAVIMIDLSRFKSVNDVYGHQGGDQLLVALCARFTGAIRDNELIGRLGGDEFGALVSFDDRADLDDFLVRLQGCLSPPFAFDRFDASIGANIGVAIAPQNGNSADVLLANADLAMYRGKAERVSEPCFYDAAMDEAVREQRNLTSDLRAAIGTDQFVLHYQVQARGDGDIAGYEALARWTHPARGTVSPGHFIPLAEQSGSIVPLGNWILRRACLEAAKWPEPFRVSVNVSPLQLADPMLVSTIRDALDESGLAPDRLIIELTESAIIRDREAALNALSAIRDMGAGLALDDFGVGYSSLDVLRSFPFDRIKLDASFVSQIEESRQAVAILHSVAELGKSLGMVVVAEGVESAEQLRIVLENGCGAIQGYLIGRPAPDLADPEAVRATVRRSRLRDRNTLVL